MMEFREEFLLNCPNCGSQYIHSGNVEVFNRAEDAKEGMHVVVDGGKTMIDATMEGNPSLHRHGLKIYFWCEGCDVHPVMEISQHKGFTLACFASAVETKSALKFGQPSGPCGDAKEPGQRHPAPQ